MTRCHFSSLRRTARESATIPALLTTMSTWPMASSAVLASARSGLRGSQIRHRHEDAPAELRGEGFERITSAACQRDLGTLSVEPPGNGAANSAGGSRHKRCSSRQVVHGDTPFS